MDPFVEASLSRFVQNRADLFGERSEYLRFEVDPKYSICGGYNATVIFGTIIYRRGDEQNRSKSLFIKQMRGTLNNHPDVETSHFMNEICFYAHVLPIFNTLKPTAYSYFPEFFDSSLRINAAKKEAATIFENLQASGYRLAARASFLDYAHLAMMLRKLGNFHAFSFKAKQEDPVRFRVLCDLFVDAITPRFRSYFNMLLRLSTNGVNKLRQVAQYASRLERLEKILESPETLAEQLLRGDRNAFESVLCHGDYLRGNVIFKYVNGKPVDMKMIDMATCILAFPVLDIAQVLYLNADQRMRDEHWDDLIDEYCAGLSELFDDIRLPSREDVLRQFRNRSFWTYFVATFFLRETISIDNNLESWVDRCRFKYGNVSLLAIPQDELCAVIEESSGTVAEEALQNILKDMLDRGFV